MRGVLGVLALLVAATAVLLGPLSPAAAQTLDPATSSMAANPQTLQPTTVATLRDVLMCPCHFEARANQSANPEASGALQLPDGASQGGASGIWYTVGSSLTIIVKGNGRAVILLKFNDQDVLTFIIYHSDGQPYDLQYVTVEESIRRFSDDGVFQVDARNYPAIYSVHGGLNSVAAIVDGSAFDGSVDTTIDGASSVIQQTPVPPNRLLPLLAGAPTHLDDDSWSIPIIAKNLGPNALHNVVATITAGGVPITSAPIGDVIVDAAAVLTVPAGAFDGPGEVRLSLRGDERYAYGSSTISINVSVADSVAPANHNRRWLSGLLWAVSIACGTIVVLLALRRPTRHTDPGEVRVGHD